MTMQPLKFSYAEWCYYKNVADPLGFYKKLYRIGYRGAEMVAAERWQFAKSTGLKIVNLIAPGMQNGLNRLENHAVLLPEIINLIQIAKANEIEQIIIFSGNRLGQLDEIGLENTTRAAEQLAPHAESAGVTLLLEVLNSSDHPDYQADASAYALEVARRVSSPAFKVLYDIYHMGRMGEDLYTSVFPSIEYIAHLHVAGSPRRDFPGANQEIDYLRLVRAFHTAGYRGYWGMEFLPVGDPLLELENALALFTSYLPS
jgi:hydroxypyruvate isomerase